MGARTRGGLGSCARPRSRALRRRDEEGLIAVMVRLVDSVDQRRPLFCAASVLAMARSAILLEEIFAIGSLRRQFRHGHVNDMVGGRPAG